MMVAFHMNLVSSATFLTGCNVALLLLLILTITITINKIVI